jgi:hypothetical protein
MLAAGIWFAVLWTVAPLICKAQPALLACMAATHAGDDVGAQTEADPLQHILQRVHNSKGDVNIIASAMSEAKTAGFCAESLSQIRQVSQAAIMSAFAEEKRFKEALKALHYRMQTAKFAKTMEVALQKADESGIPPHHPAMKKYMKRWRQTRQKQEGMNRTSDSNPTVDDIEQVARVSGDTEADDEATVAPRRLLLRQHDASLGDSSSWSSPPMVLAVTIALAVLFVGVVWFIRNRIARDSSASGELSKPPASAKRKGKARSRQSQRQQQTKKQPKTGKGGKEAEKLHQETATEAVPVSLVAMSNSIDSVKSVESTGNSVDSVNSEGSGKVAARTNSKSRKKRGKRGSRKTASKQQPKDTLCSQERVDLPAAVADPQDVVMQNGVEHSGRTAAAAVPQEAVTPPQPLSPAAFPHKLIRMTDLSPGKDLSWGRMSPRDQSAAEMLGFDAELWDSGSRNNVVCLAEWQMLTKAQRLAASVLGYGEMEWNVEVKTLVTQRLRQNLIDSGRVMAPDVTHVARLDAQADSAAAAASVANPGMQQVSSGERRTSRSRHRRQTPGGKTSSGPAIMSEDVHTGQSKGGTNKLSHPQPSSMPKLHFNHITSSVQTETGHNADSGTSKHGQSQKTRNVLEEVDSARSVRFGSFDDASETVSHGASHDNLVKLIPGLAAVDSARKNHLATPPPRDATELRGLEAATRLVAQAAADTCAAAASTKDTVEPLDDGTPRNAQLYSVRRRRDVHSPSLSGLGRSPSASSGMRRSPSAPSYLAYISSASSQPASSGMIRSQSGHRLLDASARHPLSGMKRVNSADSDLYSPRNRFSDSAWLDLRRNPACATSPTAPVGPVTEEPAAFKLGGTRSWADYPSSPVASIHEADS